MKKINLITQYTFLMLMLLAISCGKKTTPPPTTDANGLPFATQTGANTFGCLIDGVPCSITGAYNWLYTSGVSYNLDDSIISIKAISKNPRIDFHFYGKRDKTKPFSYNANFYYQITYSSINIDGGSASLGTGYYTTIDSLPALITISKFTGNAAQNAKKGDIVAGTFEMVMQNTSGKKIQITLGRFDLSDVE